MPISHHYKIFFPHIPKTGGSSIITFLGLARGRNALWGHHRDAPMDLTMQHMTVRQLLVHGFLEEKVLSDYYTFAVVRNPWDRLVSDYLFYNRAGLVFSLDKFIPHYCSGAEKFNVLRNHALAQYRFIYHGSRQYVTNIFRFEKIYEMVNKLKEITGIETPFPREKQSPNRRHYREYYTNETQELVRKAYAKDIELFDYKF